MDCDASRVSAVLRAAIERQDLAAIRTCRVYRAFQFGETALHELRAHLAGRHRYLDAGSSLAIVLAMRGEQDSVAQAVSLAEPQAVIETSHRCVLADIHLVILCRRDCGSGLVVGGQCCYGQCLVAVPLVDAKKPDWRYGEQPVDGHLNVGAHVTRKLS